MCCFLTIKSKKLQLFLTFLLIFGSWSSLSYSGEVSTQRLSASVAPRSIFTSSASLITKGLMSCALLGAGINAFALPSQPLLSFDPIAPGELITGQCYYPCTQECPTTLMVSTAQHAPLCTIPVKQKGELSSHISDVPECSELFDHDMSAVKTHNNDMTIVHFSVYPAKKFAAQEHRISCDIGGARTSQFVPMRRLDQVKKESAERRKRQANTCTPDTNNRVYLGQNNFTRCLEQNNGAEFIFVENINFSQLPSKEQDRFPLYSLSKPFSGNITMPPFSLDHFNITRNGYAAFFHALANSTINANFSNAEVTSITNAALLAIVFQDHNAIILEIDRATIHGRDYVGGIASILNSNSDSSIVLKIKKRGTIKHEHHLTSSIVAAAGMVVGLAKRNLRYNITISGNEIFMTCWQTYACGAGIGASNFAAIKPVFIDIKANLVNIAAIDVPNVGAVFGQDFFSGEDSTVKIGAYINHLTINGGNYASIFGNRDSAGTSYPTPTLVISNIQANIKAIKASALGISRVSNIQQSFTILLLSGNGVLASPNHLLFPQGSCPHSLIDWSGISFNIDNVGCTNAAFVESITTTGWRIANSRLAPVLCANNPHACHYVNEVPLAFVQGEGDTFFLVSQQTHPYNDTITGQGPIRVTQWHWNDLNAAPQINSNFSLNGTRLYSANGPVLPNSSPRSITSYSNHLLMFFEEENVKLVSLPLNASQDTFYQIKTLDNLEGDPIQLAGKNLWVQKEDQLLRSSIFPDVENSSLSISLGMNHPVVGVAQTEKYIYVAYINDINGNDTAHVLRFRENGTQDNTWQVTLPNYGHDLYRYRQLDVRGNETHPEVNLPLISEIIHDEESACGKALTVLFPPRGGYNDWRCGEPLISASLIKPYIELRKVSYHIVVHVIASVLIASIAEIGKGVTAASIAVVAFTAVAGVTAGVTGIVCHKKKVKYMKKKWILNRAYMHKSDKNT